MKSSIKVSLLIGVFLLFSVPMMSDEGRLSLAMGDSEVLAVIPWWVEEVNRPLLAVISVKHGDPDKDERLTVLRDDGNGPAPIASFDGEGLTFLTASQLGGDVSNTLLVTRMAVTGFAIQVYVYSKGSVQRALEVGSKFRPEIVRDPKGREYIMVTDLVLQKNLWTEVGGTTELYRWNGHKCEKLGPVPWERRFKCVMEGICH